MLRSASITTLALALGLGWSATAHAYATWTPWISEEGGGPPAWCGGTYEAINGFNCADAYCDQVRVRCDTIPYGITVSDYAWTAFFSEEDSGIGRATSVGWYAYDTDSSHVCYYAGTAGIMTGIRCQNSYCDQISLECAIPVTHFEGATTPVDLVDCEWTEPFSSPDPPFQLPYAHFITGVECSGPYCEDKSFYVCRVQGPVDSCMGECGGQARGGCWCDELCTTYGDCCSDYEPACVPF